LVVWQRALQLAIESYRLAAALPPNERFGLAGQLQRAAASIAMNIAEGHGRLGRGDFVRHLSMARGSLMEVETILEIAERVEFLTREELARARSLGEEVSRMLATLIRRLGGHQTRRRSGNDIRPNS
jgi:four helix bundle protein